MIYTGKISCTVLSEDITHLVTIIMKRGFDCQKIGGWRGLEPHIPFQ